jgi:hypothetical protein
MGKMLFVHDDRAEAEFTCMQALRAVASYSKTFGLPFDDNTFEVLKALGFRTRSSFRLSESGMAHARAFVAANSGANMLTGLEDLGNGYSKGHFNFGAEAYGGVTNGSSGSLGAILGRSTVYFQGGLSHGRPTGPLVGVNGGPFDYNPANHDWPVSWGVELANEQINQGCPNRHKGVSITGGYIPR